MYFRVIGQFFSFLDIVIAGERGHTNLPLSLPRTKHTKKFYRIANRKIGLTKGSAEPGK